MVSVSAAVLMWCFGQLEPFAAPGYSTPVVGAWYTGGQASSAMPLGALGTGFVDFTAAATFGNATVENNWLKPKPVGDQSGFYFEIGGKYVEFFPGSIAPGSLRFWGHYPMADVDFGDLFGDVKVYLRAYAPLVPHDYELSSLPAAFFHLTVENRGKEPVPAEISLQWQTVLESLTKAKGNVEGALGWRHDSLAAGATWTVSPTVVFAESRDRVAEAISSSRVLSTPLTGRDTARGTAYDFGRIVNFLLDGAGGFNWEDHHQQSALYNNAPQIGQVFWNLAYKATRGGNPLSEPCEFKAGRGMQGAYGLATGVLPAKTLDGALEISLRVCKAGPSSVGLAYSIHNVSGHEIHNLQFGFALNADLGGPEHAQNQRAVFDRDKAAIIFDGPDIENRVALTGDATDFIVGTWPGAHEAMLRNEWRSMTAKSSVPAVESFPDGIEMKTVRGSYALASTSGKGWALQQVRTDDDVIRARASKWLNPGEKNDVTMLLTWYFPAWDSSDGEMLRHKYAAAFEDAGKVAAAALDKADDIEKKIIDWQSRIYASKVTPFLKDAVINSLYIWPRNSWWLDDGRFFQSESFTGCPITETFVCRFNGSFPLALMFPECEKATMRSVANAQKKTGEIPFGFGSPTGSKSPYYHVQHPIVSPEFALVTWRNYALWHDDTYLNEMYPHVQAALKFAMTLDKDKDGLVNEDPGNDKGFPANQYYDVWPWWGTSAYTGSIWLAALRAGEEMARKKGDTAFADELRDWYTRGAAAFEEKLWTGAYYRLYSGTGKRKPSDTSLTNALCGQWFAYATGLGEIVPKDHIQSVIDTVLRLNVAATPFGAVNGVKPDGKIDETYPDHSAVITIGEVWNFCAMAAFAGRADDSVKLFNTSYANILLRQKTPWDIPWCLDRKTGAIKWGINYYSNPCAWTLFEALDSETYLKLAK